MFPNRIGSTAFTERYAEGAFRVKGESLVSDAVLMSVLRATLEKRLEAQDKTLTLQYYNEGYGGEYGDCEDNERNLRRTMNNFSGSSWNSDDTMTVINVGSSKIDERFKKSFLWKYESEGWRCEERISDFFKKSFDVLLFVNEEKRSVILCIARMDASRIHYTTCTLFAWFPWYFKKGEVSAEEKELLQTLRESSQTNFIATLRKFEPLFDFYGMRLVSLEGVENSWREAEKRSLSERIERTQNNIADFYRRLAELMKNKESLMMRRTAMDLAENRDNSVLEFFRDHRDALYLVECDNSNVTFEVMTKLTYWDEDVADTLINSKRSVLYEYGSHDWSDEERKMFFTALFIDRSITLRFCAAYTLRIGDMIVDARSHFEYGRECDGYFRNTHIDQYSCIGGYESSMTQAMEAHNYCGAIEMCMNSACGLTLTDSTVMEKFVKLILVHDKKVIEMEDGTLVTPREAVELLKANAKEEEGES